MWWRKDTRRKQTRRKKIGIRGTHGQYLTYKEYARRLVENRLRHFNQHYKFSVNKIFIRNQKSRWGSCSSKGNLNFNYKIALLPPHVADYVIVHELCHLGQFNHSPKFWALVAQTVPDWKKARRELKKLPEKLSSQIVTARTTKMVSEML